jgi:hypothetical protein
MQIGAEAGDGATSTFACFLFGTYESSVLGFFNPVPILSTPAFSTDGITVFFARQPSQAHQLSAVHWPSVQH